MADNTPNNDSPNFRTEGPIPPPSIDPTAATNDAIKRAINAERDYVAGEIKALVTRLDAMDEATKVLNETVTRTPTDIEKEVKHLRELTFQKFKGVATQFEERDTRQERESRDNRVAVDAAFAAQKEAAAEQNKSNTLAIDKSEKATAETLNKQADLFQSTLNALQQQVSDLKERLNEQSKNLLGREEYATTHKTLIDKYDSLNTQIVSINSQSRGSQSTVSRIYAGLAAAAAAIGIVVLFANGKL